MYIKIIIEEIEVQIVAFEITERAEFRQFQLVQGDTGPIVKAQFINERGIPVDLTDFSVDFFFRRSDSPVTLNAGHTACTVTDPLKGKVSYQWQLGDTDQLGIHFGDFLLTGPGIRQSLRDALRFEVRSLYEGVSGV